MAVKAPKAAKLTKEDTSSAKQQKNIKPIPKEKSYLNMFNEKLGKPKPVKKPVPFTKPCGYLEIYKKVSFTNLKASFTPKWCITSNYIIVSEIRCKFLIC